MQREFLNYKNRYFIILNRIQTHNSQINGLILTKYPVLSLPLCMTLIPQHYYKIFFLST